MKPTHFPTVNVVFGENQEGVEPLPARVENGTVSTMWELSPEEVSSVKETGKIILEMYTGGGNPYPVRILTLHENERRRG